ncbi:hypothetical protein KOR42_53770 [Thalassoglobus neptunius]|uniref:PEP-CTERM protein-sorting domain-containing protein n=1 Tax=Thalassoglobus neptunius TaxID=1938619 RepID=A0A5C5V6T5_9PLAN|nr:discoidin domain-containing protein [Thalassoglobus neptunius]TWT33432.1 hypothetical protein KOR42_53770 [Thalassoglobus neptunius]
MSPNTQIGFMIVLSMYLHSTMTTADAGTILQPVSAVASDERVFGTLHYMDDALVDQSGLVDRDTRQPNGYVSGVTDFDTYIASGPVHIDTSNAIWATNADVTTAIIDFDLGGQFTIDGMALWNRGNNLDNQIGNFELFADDNNAFTSPVIIGSYLADGNLGDSLFTGVEVFRFTATTASHIRMSITSNLHWNGSGILSAGEVAFRQANSIPEPATGFLIVTGSASILAFFRRWKSR